MQSQLTMIKLYNAITKKTTKISFIHAFAWSFELHLRGEKTGRRKGFTETHAVKPWLKIYRKNFSLPHFRAIGRLTH